MTCTYNDFETKAQEIVKPAYLGNQTPGSNKSRFVNNFNNFYDSWLQNSWTSYKNKGCECFKEKLDDSQSKLVRANTAAYMKSVLEAKIKFAKTMHKTCGCSGNIAPEIDQVVASATTGRVNVARTRPAARRARPAQRQGGSQTGSQTSTY